MCSTRRLAPTTPASNLYTMCDGPTKNDRRQERRSREFLQESRAYTFRFEGTFSDPFLRSLGPPPPVGTIGRTTASPTGTSAGRAACDQQGVRWERKKQGEGGRKRRRRHGGRELGKAKICPHFGRGRTFGGKGRENNDRNST